MEFGIPSALENIPEVCVGCGKHFIPINEEAEGTHEVCPPELRCRDCQLAYRLANPGRGQQWVIGVRANIAEALENLQYLGTVPIVRLRTRQEMIRKAYM